MKYRYEALLNGESASTAATKNLDIDLSQPVSKFLIQIKGTNNGSTPTAHGAKMIQNVELSDGSEIIHSLTGLEMQALNFYENGRMPFQVNEYTDDVQNIQTFEINFGRWLWDPELALDPNRFRNLNMKIKHNKALGGSVPDAANLWVYAFIFDEKKINPRGYLQSREHQTYSLTSSATERIDLPVDLTIRKLIVQSLSGGKQPWEQYNQIKLIEDDGKKTSINDLKVSDLLKLFKQDRHIFETIIGTGTGSAVDHFVASTYDMESAVGPRDSALAATITPQDFGGTLSVNTDTTEHFQVLVRGKAPHGALEIPFGNQKDMNDWLDLVNVKSLKVDIKAGSSVGSSSTAEIVLQQLRLY